VQLFHSLYDHGVEKFSVGQTLTQISQLSVGERRHQHIVSRRHCRPGEIDELANVIDGV
jgi:hypothetical protein